MLNERKRIQATQRRERRKLWKAEGKCRNCGARKAESNAQRCSICIRRDAVRAVTRYYTRKESGICTKCGKNIVIDNHTMCDTCTLKHLARQHLKDTKLWTVLRSLLEKQNYQCYYTGKPLTIGDKSSALDHLNPQSRFPEQAQDPNNLCWSSWEANHMKNNYTEQEFLDEVARIYRYRNIKENIDIELASRL